MTTTPAPYAAHRPVGNAAFDRGFLLATIPPQVLTARLAAQPWGDQLSGWSRTWFGPATLWVDPLQNYATAREGAHAVGVMGFCIDPEAGLNHNQPIAEALLAALITGRRTFLDHVDRLAGSFVIIWRHQARIFVMQDAAATRPVYYHRRPGDPAQTAAEPEAAGASDVGEAAATSHIQLLAALFDLPRDPRATAVFADTAYRGDPSRYLPGLITPFAGALPLTANTELDLARGTPLRFFPREPLAPRAFGPDLVAEIAALMRAQADLVGALGRPLHLAATGGRDSRTSAVTFSGQPHLRYFSFHMPASGHLTPDTEIARRLAAIEGVPIDIYNLEDYRDADVWRAGQLRNPRSYWPAAANCYWREFAPDAIHIRSTVSEIGRIFHTRRSATAVTPEVLARTYTATAFHDTALCRDAMAEFIAWTGFDTAAFHGYDLYDMFYWEHRNAKWQNVLCSEAEMATDVFIPFNNRNLLKLFMAVPYENRRRADIHFALCDSLKPAFKSVPIV